MHREMVPRQRQSRGSGRRQEAGGRRQGAGGRAERSCSRSAQQHSVQADRAACSMPCSTQHHAEQTEQHRAQQSSTKHAEQSRAVLFRSCRMRRTRLSCGSSWPADGAPGAPRMAVWCQPESRPGLQTSLSPATKSGLVRGATGCCGWMRQASQR